MKTIYSKDLDNKKIFVTREFAAPLEKVWRAWTDPEIIDQWWAPKPWKANTVSMDFSNGGQWLYFMQGPDGTKSYCKAEFDAIIIHKSYNGIDCFCDENGVKNEAFPSMHWQTVFSATAIGCKVEIELTFASKEDLEKIVELGFETGFEMAHGNLDEILAQA